MPQPAHWDELFNKSVGAAASISFDVDALYPARSFKERRAAQTISDAYRDWCNSWTAK
jgi:hypothetical protein